MIEQQDELDNQRHKRNLVNYYRIHSKIYDATRWGFLFGRQKIFDMLPKLPDQPRILEVGCGTGKMINLLLQYYPAAEIVGVDLSPDMLKVAQRNIKNSNQISLINAEYRVRNIHQQPFDLILCSYSVTMMDQPLDDIFNRFSMDLRNEGAVAIVDFHSSPFSWFRRWMNLNHVDFSGQLLPNLHRHFHPITSQKHKAYIGLWSYFHFIGKCS